MYKKCKWNIKHRLNLNFCNPETVKKTEVKINLQQVMSTLNRKEEEKFLNECRPKAGKGAIENRMKGLRVMIFLISHQEDERKREREREREGGGGGGVGGGAFFPFNSSFPLAI